MTKSSKMVAVFTAVALLATGPAAGPMALFAQTVGRGVTSGANTRVTTGNIGGPRTGFGGSTVRLTNSHGASVYGVLGNAVGQKPMVIQERMATPGIMGLGEMPVNVVGQERVQEIGVPVVPGQEVPFRSVQDYSLPYNNLITGAEARDSKSAQERVATPVEQDIHTGKVRFDGADKSLGQGEVPTVSFEGTGTGGGAGLKPNTGERAAAAADTVKPVVPAAAPAADEGREPKAGSPWRQKNVPSITISALLSLPLAAAVLSWLSLGVPLMALGLYAGVLLLAVTVTTVRSLDAVSLVGRAADHLKYMLLSVLPTVGVGIAAGALAAGLATGWMEAAVTAALSAFLISAVLQAFLYPRMGPPTLHYEGSLRSRLPFAYLLSVIPAWAVIWLATYTPFAPAIAAAVMLAWAYLLIAPYFKPQLGETVNRFDGSDPAAKFEAAKKAYLSATFYLPHAPDAWLSRGLENWYSDSGPSSEEIGIMKEAIEHASSSTLDTLVMLVSGDGAKDEPAVIVLRDGDNFNLRKIVFQSDGLSLPGVGLVPFKSVRAAVGYAWRSNKSL